MADAALPITLRFVEWSCGHHQQRPADIPVASVAQAHAILTAISHAISQPGCARAVLFDATCGVADIYLSDDHLSDLKPDSELREDRPVLIHGDAETVAAILAPELQEAREQCYAEDLPFLDALEQWDGRAPVDPFAVLLTTQEPAAIEREIAEGPDAYPPRASLFILPPRFVPAVDVLAALRTLAAELAQEAAERAKEAQQ